MIAMTLRKSLAFFLFCILIDNADAQKNKNQHTAIMENAGQQWSAEKAKAWYTNHQWIIGADYIPSNAINQLEMWQASTFDSVTNDRELGWAENIGFNSMRVFLHSLAWKEDKDGFKKRLQTFLSIADRHHIQ